MSCPPPDQLIALRAGTLSADERRALEAHLLFCGACASQLLQLQGPLATPSVSSAPSDVTNPVPERFPDAAPAVESSGPVPQVQRIGPYILLDRLGAGGVGTVYAAYHPELDRQVAVKLLHSDQKGGQVDTAAQGRLLREAQALARLSHPNVVAVHDAGTWEGRVFLVMEHVPGTDLREWLKETPRSWREVRDAFLQAGEGLEAAHTAGLVHRDFKPANVLLGKDRRIRVADFGLARAAQGLDSPPELSEGRTLTPGAGTRLDITLTQAGYAVGTPAYMAPEQLLGRPADARADQFSFCVSLWEALYGQRPWLESKPGARRGPLTEPTEKRDVPAFLRTLLDRGLAEDPAQRFPSMQALLDALRADPEAKRRRRNLSLVLATAALVVVGLGAWGALRQRDAAARVCERPVSAFSGTWDEAARGRLRSAFDATHVAWASDVLGRVEKGLDAYVAEWERLDRRLCEATLVQRSQSEETRRQQSACLERRRGEVQALVTLLGQADAPMVDRAVSATVGLSSPQGCADLKRLAHEPPGPMNVHNAPAVAEWRMALQQAEARIRLGQYPESEAVAKDVVAKAQAAQEPAVAAAGLTLVSMVQSRMGQEEESLATEKQAFNAALAGRDDLVAFQAANGCASACAILGKTKEGLEWESIALGLLARLGETPELHAIAAITHFYVTRGSTGLLGGGESDASEAADSIKLAEAAAVAARAGFGADNPKTHAAMINQGVAYADAGRFQDAINLERQLVTIFEATYGEMNPLMVPLLTNMGADLQSVGQLDEALAVNLRAQRLSRAAFGEVNAGALTQATSLSFILRKLGRADEAHAQLVKAIEATRPTLSKTINFGFALVEWGWVEFARGDLKTARKAWEEGRAFLAKLGQEIDSIQREFEDGLGQLELATGRPAQAIPLLEKALALREKSQSPVDDTALTRFALARALGTTAKGKARARELLEKAERELEGLPFRQRELEQVKALRARL